MDLCTGWSRRTFRGPKRMRCERRSVAGRCAVFAFLVAALSIPAVAGDALTVVALSRAPVDGALEVGQFARFDSAPVINNIGQVAFLAGPEVSRDGQYNGANGVWLFGAGGLREVAGPSRTVTLPGAATGGGSAAIDAEFSTVTDVLLNNAGDVAFQADLAPEGGGATLDSLWIANQRGLSAVAYTGKPLPQFGADRSFDSFATVPALADDGAIAFHAFIRDNNNIHGSRIASLWVGDDASIDVVAHAGGDATVPGEPDVTFNTQSFEIPFGYHPVVTNGRTTMFSGFLQGPDITVRNGHGLWRSTGDTGLAMTMRSDTVVAGTNGDPLLSFPNIPGINRHGQYLYTAFYGYLNGLDQPFEGSAAGAAEPREELLTLGVWSNRTGELAPIMRLGDAANGLDGNATFVDFTPPLMNEAGAMAFHGVVAGEGIDGTNELGVWSEGLSGWGNLNLVTRMGEQAPGADEGVVFQTFQQLAMNARGQVAFMGNVRGEGVSDANGNVIGLWAQDASGELQLVARAGDTISIAPGDERTIESLLFASEGGGDDGRALGLNDRGQVAFRALFTDGSAGIFISNVAAVPEPSTMLLLGIGIACAALWLCGGQRSVVISWVAATVGRGRRCDCVRRFRPIVGVACDTRRREIASCASHTDNRPNSICLNNTINCGRLSVLPRSNQPSGFFLTRF